MIKPNVGEKFYDNNNRSLLINSVSIGDKLGREVQGKLIGKYYVNKEWKTYPDYSCTLKDWADIWRDKIPSSDPSTFKC